MNLNSMMNLESIVVQFCNSREGTNKLCELTKSDLIHEHSRSLGVEFQFVAKCG